MNILSLFDGMSCGQLALARAKIPVTRYYASEIDKYAMTVTQANFPNTIQLGDVVAWRNWDIDWSSIDILLGGSPCQGFSFAGKQLAFDDPRSKLFFVYVDILNHIKQVNPSVRFLLENVRMKKEYLDVISEHLGVEWVNINSNLVCGANRNRYYWFNWEVDQPKDKGIYFQDCLEKDFANIDKAPALTATYGRGGGEATRIRNFERHSRPIAWLIQRPRGNNKGGIRGKNGKAPSMTANSWHLNVSVSNGEITRHVTPLECERLMTVPEGYTDHVSKTQRYKMLGNGWTVDVIAHILATLPLQSPLPSL